MRSTIAFSF